MTSHAPAQRCLAQVVLSDDAITGCAAAGVASSLRTLSNCISAKEGKCGASEAGLRSTDSTSVTRDRKEANSMNILREISEMEI